MARAETRWEGEPIPGSSVLQTACLLPVLAVLQVAADPPARAPAMEDGTRSGPTWVEREAFLMGTRLRVELAAPSRDAGFRAASAAFEAVEAAEARWSSWRRDTDLARLNRAEPGSARSLPSPMARILAGLERWRALTGGAFDPAVGPLIHAWGLRADGRTPGPEELERARAASGLDHFRIDTVRATVTRLRAGAWLDAGAFGKGLALSRARNRLESAGVEAALLDFGGQLVAWGSGPGRTGCWTAGVADPGSRDVAAATMELCDASASTTSGSERFAVVDGEVRTHVMDPRTGRPAPAWGSVTVVHPDPMTADLLSTALFVMGPEEGLSWARETGTAALFLKPRDGGALRASTTREMERHLLEKHPIDERTGTTKGKGRR